jgi:Leucine-rich repeat (LRR) protein
MKKLLLYIIPLFFIGQWSFAQTTFVPDTNLRKFLFAKLPSYLDANKNVVDAKAAGYTATIDCSSLQIKDLTGLWKFTGLISLACHINSISNVDSVVKLTKLTYFICFKNNISKLPDLSPLTKLVNLSCGTNKLSSFPDLSKNTPLTYLDCSNNALTTLKGLDKLVNLQTLYAYNNKLDSLPNLSNLTKLQILVCQGNNLTNLPGLGRLTQLTQLVAGDNKFDSLPNLSGLTKLKICMVYNCQLTSMPNINTMSNLTQLVMSGNKISSLPNFSGNPNLTILELDNNLIAKMPDISACKDTLKSLKINNNRLDSLPNFSLFTKLDTTFVQNNRLTFEDVIPLAQDTSILNVKYSPQDSVGTSQTFLTNEKQSFRLVLGIDKKVANNQYTWYKNGQVIASTTTDTLLISQVQATDSGLYSCQVRNALAPLLILTSRITKLKVIPCIDLSKLIYTTTDVDCNLGGSVYLKEASIAGGQKPYSYKLTGNELGTTRFPDGSSFSNLFENAYTLEVKDQSGCKATFAKTIELKGKRGIDCKGLVIIGNDYSPNNTLLLEEKGTAKVYDKDGQLVQSFSTPSTWDGRNKNGELLPGYYVIDLNGKMLNVTVIK